MKDDFEGVFVAVSGSLECLDLSRRDAALVFESREGEGAKGLMLAFGKRGASAEGLELIFGKESFHLNDGAVCRHAVGAVVLDIICDLDDLSLCFGKGGVGVNDAAQRLVALDENGRASEDSKNIRAPAEGTDEAIKSIKGGGRSGFWCMCLHNFYD